MEELDLLSTSPCCIVVARMVDLFSRITEVAAMIMIASKPRTI